VAIALGLPADTPIKEIYKVYEERAAGPVGPVVVKNGPCKQNKMLADEVDLYEFPSPMCHEGDGGRYMGTWGFIVCKDPDSDWVNWGMYRFHINSRRSLAISPGPGSNLTVLLREKFFPKNRPVQIAAVIGADPLSSIAASAGIPAGESEVYLAGGLRQESIELVKCETNNLLVPAHAEIIVEGEIIPEVSAPEGPFGEYSGYRTSGWEPKPYCQVTAITYRDSPIITMSNLGVPPDDSHVGGCISTAIAVKTKLQRKGIPVVDVYLPPEGAAYMMVVSVSKGGPEVVKSIADAFGKRRAVISKIVVVDDDIDIFNTAQVIHAFAVKCHSTQGIHLRETPEGTGNVLSPANMPGEGRELKGAMAFFDATWSPSWQKQKRPVKAAFSEIYPQDIQDRVVANWSRYGFNI
jgi:4-hydroxy-3-polyprenylbenzoate decarboxylase